MGKARPRQRAGGGQVTTLGWIIIGIIAWLVLVIFICRWFHVCKKRREAIEAEVRRSVRGREI